MSFGAGYVPNGLKTLTLELRKKYTTTSAIHAERLENFCFSLAPESQKELHDLHFFSFNGIRLSFYFFLRMLFYAIWAFTVWSNRVGALRGGNALDTIFRARIVVTDRLEVGTIIGTDSFSLVRIQVFDLKRIRKLDSSGHLRQSFFHSSLVIRS